MGDLGRVLVVLVALWVGFAGSPAEASESRVGSFSFPCDGTNQVVTFTTGGLGNNVTRFIQGAEVTLFENHGGLQSIFLSAVADNRVLVSLNPPANRASNQFNGFFPVQTSGTGTVNFSVSGACNSGFGQVQGVAIVWFFS
jgi:hypothetical protein